MQAATQRKDLDKLDVQAKQALSLGREDLARAALERKQLAASQLASFDPQIEQLENEQRRLSEAESRLSAKIEAFRTRKEMIKAQYTAAKAQVRIGEAVTGLSEEMADVGYSIQRAEDKTAQLQSRGDAIGELIDQGVLTDALESGTPLDRELEKVAAQAQIEQELQRLRGEMVTSAAPKQLEAGQ